MHFTTSEAPPAGILRPSAPGVPKHKKSFFSARLHGSFTNSQLRWVPYCSNRVVGPGFQPTITVFMMSQIASVSAFFGFVYRLSSASRYSIIEHTRRSRCSSSHA